ncbi:unnamed protein product, partial [Rotaria magnacalcarata]
HALESQNIILESSDAHHIQEPLQQPHHQETTKIESENEAEQKPPTQYNDQLQEALRWEELIPDSTQLKDDIQEAEDYFDEYEQSLSPHQTPSEETHQP